MPDDVIPRNFYEKPATARCRMVTKDAKACLLFGNTGTIQAGGREWRVVARHVAAGVYDVQLEEMGAAPSEENSNE